MTKEERAASRARCNAATEGPWFAHESHNWHKDPPKEYYVITRGMNDIVTSWAETADAQFIAHARTDLPAALDDLDAKDVEIDRLQARAERAERSWAWANQEYNSLPARCEAREGALKEGQCCIACTARPGCGQILPCERFVLDKARRGRGQR